MRVTRTTLGAGISLILLTATAATALPAGARSGSPPVTVLLQGLSSPKGLDVSGPGDLVIAQGAFGAPGEVLVYPLRGRGHGNPFAVTSPANLADVAVSPLDGTGWALGYMLVGDPGAEEEHAFLLHQLVDGTIDPVLDITLYQLGDPDPDDLDDPPFPEESNPYGLTVMANGDALVADAAGNDIIRVTPAGAAWTVARLVPEVTSTADVPPGFPFSLPPEMPSEAVPTSVTIGPDGAIYVGELQGFPFKTGTSQIWRIEPDAVDAVCEVGGSDEDCSVHRDGFTGIQDIDFDPNTGRLYVYELAADGVFAFEAGFETGEFPPAVLLEVKRNGWVELAAGQLSEPGGIIVGRDSKVFVTDNVFSDFIDGDFVDNGRLVRVVG